MKRKTKDEENYSIAYETGRPPRDVDIENYKKQIESQDEKFKNIGVELPKKSKSTSVPLQIQLDSLNNLKERKGSYPPED
jgi:hypothetical protein